MTVLPVVFISAVLLFVAYVTYGQWVMRWLGIDGDRRTPAIEKEDGNDYVPAPPGVVLGGHFTAIAAAGPVVGPILAGLAFGWVPALMWILVGAIFVGAVHDSGALMASIRHQAASITQVVREHISRRAYLTFLAFVWISLLYVIVAFTDVVAGTFAKFELISTATTGVTSSFPINGGAVAIGATAYLVFSVLLGLTLRFTKLKWWLGLLASVIGLAAVIHFSPSWAQWLAGHGLKFLDTQSATQEGLRSGWVVGLILYCFVASVVPMWLLLQPRGTIGATFLYAALTFGVGGTLIGGWSTSGPLAIQYPAFRDFTASAGPLFPVLFITIACGACSGFHSIVATGTTSKQIRNERDIKPVAFGAMLLEAMVAVFALTCVMVLTPDQAKGTPDVLYARGVGTYMNLCGIPLTFAIGFGLLAFSSFVFDTLDVCTRLGRYVLQEILGISGMKGAVISTAGTLLLPAMYLMTAPAGAFRTFWTLFGTSNQLLAALTLVGVSVWLWRTKRPVWFALLPAGFMLLTTCTALILNVVSFGTQFTESGSSMAVLNGAIALLLLGLATLVASEGVRVWLAARDASAATNTMVPGS